MMTGLGISQDIAHDQKEIQQNPQNKSNVKERNPEVPFCEQFSANKDQKEQCQTALKWPFPIARMQRIAVK